MNHIQLIGIDPGASGGIAVLDVNTSKVVATKMPDTPKDIFDLFARIKSAGPCHAILEHVGGRPKMSATAMFSFGRNYGSVLTSLHGNKISFDTATPQKWMAIFQLGSSKNHAYPDWKRHLKNKAQQIFPDHTVTLWSADALLLVEYLRRTIK